ncbi:DUF6879 family protein [Streptomyces harbinensis]|uniref:DUF6879 family protein n=1 Tax=Streptomyces harbinensis TaxID=1176198 RepID=UPI0034DF051E
MAGEPEFDELLNSAQHSAYHLEMRDGYMLDEDYRAWASGGEFDGSDPRWSWWDSLISGAVSRGVEVHRARIISEPVSSYIRYEHEVTGPLNVKAGEVVRWLPRRRATDIALPGNDFWLFDGTTLLINHFSGDGDMTGKEIVTDPGTIKLCASAFATVWERATPHEEYQPD